MSERPWKTPDWIQTAKDFLNELEQYGAPEGPSMIRSLTGGAKDLLNLINEFEGAQQGYMIDNLPVEEALAIPGAGALVGSAPVGAIGANVVRRTPQNLTPRVPSPTELPKNVERWMRASDQGFTTPVFHWRRYNSEQEAPYPIFHVGSEKSAEDRFQKETHSYDWKGAWNPDNIDEFGQTLPLLARASDVLGPYPDVNLDDPLRIMYQMMKQGDLSPERMRRILKDYTVNEDLDVPLKKLHEYIQVNDEPFKRRYTNIANTYFGGVDRVDPKTTANILYQVLSEDDLFNDPSSTISLVDLYKSSLNKLMLDNPRLHRVQMLDDLIKRVEELGATGISYVNDVEDKGSLSYVFPDPKHVRSIFAEFDPDKVDEVGYMKKDGGRIR